MNIYAVRHGETDLNAKNVAQGAGTDEALNDIGIFQAENANNIPCNIDYIFCSPMIRTKQTAEILNKKINSEIIYHPLLIERHYGEFEGLNRVEYAFHDFWNYSLDKKYSKAENISNLFSRVKSFIDILKKDYSDKNVMLVTHGGVIRAINAYVTGNYETDSIINSLPNNCEIREYEI